MELRLWLDATHPVSGRLGVNSRDATAFVGWLGLLGVLEALVASGPVVPAGDGSCRATLYGGDDGITDHAHRPLQQLRRDVFWAGRLVVMLHLTSKAWSQPPRISVRFTL